MAGSSWKKISPPRACSAGHHEDAIPETKSTSHLQENIDMIARHERDFLERRTKAERLGDTVASGVGSLKFVVAHALIFIAWMAVNTFHIAGIPHFDSAPFELLALIFAFEAIMLSSFVLMRQSRMARRADERDHLELQVLLLTEKEITAVLSLCRSIAHHIGLRDEAAQPAVAKLSEETPIDEMAQTIRENLPHE